MTVIACTMMIIVIIMNIVLPLSANCRGAAMAVPIVTNQFEFQGLEMPAILGNNKQLIRKVILP
jgi:hypothetical protein